MNKTTRQQLISLDNAFTKLQMRAEKIRLDIEDKNEDEELIMVLRDLADFDLNDSVYNALDKDSKKGK